MDDVIQIAPAGDRSVSQYEREGVKVIDYTSHDKDTAYYDMVLKKEGETLLIKFEPDDKYLEAVEFKYRQKGNSQKYTGVRKGVAEIRHPFPVSG